MSHFTIHYDPPPYGEIIPHDQCKHDPAGHLMVLGFEIRSKGKRKFLHRDGWFCMKCGEGHHTEAENWIDLWWFVKEELKGKCWQFDCRLTELAEAAFGDFQAFMQATLDLINERRANMIGEASR